MVLGIGNLLLNLPGESSLGLSGIDTCVHI